MRARQYGHSLLTTLLLLLSSLLTFAPMAAQSSVPIANHWQLLATTTMATATTANKSGKVATLATTTTTLTTISHTVQQSTHLAASATMIARLKTWSVLILWSSLWPEPGNKVREQNTRQGREGAAVAAAAARG